MLTTLHASSKIESLIKSLLDPSSRELPNYIDSLIDEIVEDNNLYHEVCQRLQDLEDPISTSILNNIQIIGISKFKNLFNEVLDVLNIDSDALSQIISEYSYLAFDYFSGIERISELFQILSYIDNNNSLLSELLYLHRDIAKNSTLLSALALIGSNEESFSFYNLVEAVNRGLLSTPDIEDSLENIGFLPSEIESFLEKLNHRSNDLDLIWLSAFRDSMQTNILSDNSLINQILSPEVCINVISDELTPAKWINLRQSLFKIATHSDPQLAIRAKVRMFALGIKYLKDRNQALGEVINPTLDLSESLDNSMFVDFLFTEDISGNYHVGKNLRNLLNVSSKKAEALRTMCAIYLHDINNSSDGELKTRVSRELIGALQQQEITFTECKNQLQVLINPNEIDYICERITDHINTELPAGKSISQDLLIKGATTKSTSPIEIQIGESIVKASKIIQLEFGNILGEEEIIPLAGAMQNILVNDCKRRLDRFVKYSEPFLDSEILYRLMEKNPLNSDILSLFSLAVCLNYISSRIPRDLQKDFQSLSSLLLVSKSDESRNRVFWGNIIRHPSQLSSQQLMLDLSTIPKNDPWLVLARYQNSLSTIVKDKISIIYTFRRLRLMLEALPQSSWNNALHLIKIHLNTYQGDYSTIKALTGLIICDAPAAGENLNNFLKKILVHGHLEVNNRRLYSTLRIVRSSGIRTSELLGTIIKTLPSSINFEAIEASTNVFKDRITDVLSDFVSPFFRFKSLYFQNDRSDFAGDLLFQAARLHKNLDLSSIATEGILPCINECCNKYKFTTTSTVIKLVKLAKEIGSECAAKTLKNDVSWIITAFNKDPDKIIDIITERANRDPKAFCAAINTVRIYATKYQSTHDLEEIILLLDRCMNIASEFGEDFLWGEFEEVLLGNSITVSVNLVPLLASLAESHPVNCALIFKDALLPLQRALGDHLFQEHLEEITTCVSTIYNKSPIVIHSLLLPIIERYKEHLDPDIFSSMTKWLENSDEENILKTIQPIKLCLRAVGFEKTSHIPPFLFDVAFESAESAAEVIEREVLTCFQVVSDPFSKDELFNLKILLFSDLYNNEGLLSQGIAPVLCEYQNNMTEEILNVLKDISSTYSNATDILWYGVRPYLARSKNILSATELNNIVKKIHIIFHSARMNTDELGLFVTRLVTTARDYESLLETLELGRSFLSSLQNRVGLEKPINKYRLAAESEIFFS